MRAVTWQGIGRVAVEEVPDPVAHARRSSLEQAPQACAELRKKADGMVTVVFEP